jgi:proline iminopeptidase
MRLQQIYFLAIVFLLACNGKSTKSETSSTAISAGDSTSVPQYVTIGGIPQAVLVRGENINNPVLLMMHGGPGFSEMALFATYNKALEKDFVVAIWDQRGAGLSYSPTIPDSTMNIRQFVSDAHEVVSWLKKKYNKQKIYLLGHSWGSALGVNLVKQYPEDFYAFVGVCQVVNMMENESITFKYTLDTAIAENNTEAIKELKSIQHRYPLNGTVAVEDLKLQRKWLDYYGGAVYREKNSHKFFKRIPTSENPLFDEAKVSAGERYTFNLMLDDLMTVNFLQSAPKLEVPVYFFTGRHDYNAVTPLIEKYVQVLQAPHKEIVWFENSAHWLPFEEPEKLYDVMVNKVRKHSTP